MWIRKKVQTLPWEINLNFEAIMINYSLICKQEHKFEGWFRTSADYEEQVRKGLVSCPTCHDNEISKALMAPAVKSSKKLIEETSNKKMNNISKNTEYKAIAGENEIRSILRNMKKYIENNCENMGENFANEARLIAKGDAKERGIYGKVSSKEAEELLDEGIEVNAIPWLKDDA